MASLDNPRRERIVKRFLEEELRESFIDYSMSVIVQRALPDARDGLKPVQRRILYAMHELGLRPDRAHKKSATVVGDVLGKYHPHGDSAVYDTLVRLVQTFSSRYPLIDGQGNFGSIDGDTAAAYRYTEARLAPIATELLDDIDKETVDFRPNFDGRLQEPEVLPSGFPQLLANGTDGIAVGMATKLPPHNLGEIAEAAIKLLMRPNLTVETLMQVVQGPDFPTGAYIWGREGVEEALRTGRGRVIMRARAHVEEGAYGKPYLVVTELPYQVSKGRVLESIAKLARRGRLEGVTDLRDESDRDGVRIVIELKREATPRKVLDKLFRRTRLQSTYGVIALALVDGVPTQLNLKDALSVWIEHRLEVIERRARHELERARERAHVLEGLLAALDHIEDVVEIIKSSRTPESAARKLRSELEISERQADAILAMRLARLTNLESRKLRKELESLEKRIASLESLLEDEKKRRQLIKTELSEIAVRFGDARRTEILSDEGRFPLPSQGAEREMHVLYTRKGYIKALPIRSGRSERGLAAAESLQARSGDFVTDLWICNSEDHVLAFTAGGQVYATQVDALPEGTRSSRGRRLAEILEMEEDPVAVLTVSDFPEDRYVVTATRKARVKRTPLSEYQNIRAGGIIAAGVDKKDEIIGVRITDGQDDVILATRKRQTIRFEEPEVRSMGRTAGGVKGIELGRGDRVVSLVVPRRKASLLAISANGYARTVALDDLRVQGRGGKGMQLLSGADKPGDLVRLLEILPNDHVVALDESGGAFRIDIDVAELPDGRGDEGGITVEIPSGVVTDVVRAPAASDIDETGEAQMTLQI